MTLFDALGQQGALEVAVTKFYERVLADPRLQDYFSGVNIERLHRHQLAFLMALTGGPERYQGKGIAEAHAGLGITDEDFGLVAGHLVETLRGLGIEEELVGDVFKAVAGFREEIVG